MSRDRGYSSIAFVSGKGGVGKTTITANIAWLISVAPAHTLIIDLDFQNLGCTGLFASRQNLEESYTLALLRTNCEQENQPILTRITEKLWFLPAAPITQTTEHIEFQNAFLGIPDDLYKRLDKLLSYLHEIFSIDFFVLDCHGGIDATSIAAAGVCDYTMVVTEADTVTFAGTLGLVDSYYSQYGSSDRKPRIEYIVNRIPPRYRWKYLDKLYREYLGKRLGQFTKSKSVLSYIPAERYLADSFGDYPFQVELAPSSLFARKLKLILYSLFCDLHPDLLSIKMQKKYRIRLWHFKLL
ncbi:CpaE family protein [Candidatus Poribacteria bacterium]